MNDLGGLVPKVYGKDVTFQSYDPKASILGVRIEDKWPAIDEAGSFVELCRVGALAEDSYNLQQVNVSTLIPGGIKAFHIHPTQTDIWYTLPFFRLLVLLVDLRKDSATYANEMRVTLGGGRSRFLHIPPGVAHGVKNLGTSEAVLIYMVDRLFQFHGEEARLPYDYFGAAKWDLIAE